MAGGIRYFKTYYPEKICIKCRCDIKQLLTIDHIWELTDGSKGFGFKAGNFQYLCKTCHNIKSKIFTLRRNELGKKLTMEESHELNKAFLEGKYSFIKVEGVKRVIMKNPALKDGVSKQAQTSRGMET